MSKVASLGWRYARSGPISAVLKHEPFDLLVGKHQAVVKMKLAPLHRVDSAVINGTALGRQRVTMEAFPRIGGCEGVGEVVSAGGATNIKPGDTVWVAPPHGTWATMIAVDPAWLHPIEPALAPLAVYASTLLTAQQLLHGYKHLRSGDVLIQNGGSSATALAVSALAQQSGVHVLTAATPGERYADAEARHAKFKSRVFEYNAAGARAMQAGAMRGAGAALFLNGVGGRYVDSFLKLMAPQGDVVTFGAQNGFGLLISGSNLIYHEITVHGFFFPKYLTSLSYGERQTQLDFVLRSLAKADFAYPTRVAASLDDLPQVWDDTFIHGGQKGVVKIASA